MALKDENYYTVFGWMRNDLHLKGNELTIYALIYSFSQDGESEFKGSISYIKDFTGAGRTTIKSILASLEERGYIAKCNRNKDTGETNAYRAIPREEIRGGQISTTPQTETVHPVAENRPPRGQISTPIIISDNNFDINTCNKKESKKEGRKEDITNARESYDDIVAKHGIVDDEERAAVFELVRACHLNGRTLTNEQLERNLVNILTYPTKAERVTAIYQTIDSGAGIVKPKPDLHYDVLGIKSANRQRRYEDIINDCVYDFDDRVKSALWDFIAYRQANGKIITNEALASLCAKLNRLYRPSDTVGKVKELQNAIRGGYSDIKDGEDWIAQAVREGKEQGKELFAEGVE